MVPDRRARNNSRVSLLSDLSSERESFVFDLFRNRSVQEYPEPPWLPLEAEASRSVMGGGLS